MVIVFDNRYLVKHDSEASVVCSQFVAGHTHARGFTLIELLVVVTVLAILLTVGIPSFRETIISNRIKNASFDVYSSLIQARSEAVTRNNTVTITPTDASDWAKGWTVRENAGGTIVRRQDAAEGITITGSLASLTFNGMGRLTVTTVGQFTVTATNATDAQKRCVIIDPSGRPATKTGACS
jgi:type IV fimbrial biogenesis protein FimT